MRAAGIQTPLGENEGHGWVRMGRRPGPVMRAYGFMRVERVYRGWRAWDVIKGYVGRHPYETTIHKTMRAGNARHRKKRENGTVARSSFGVAPGPMQSPGSHGLSRRNRRGCR